jgi:uncharacterized protein (DUF1684 family)
MMETKLYARHLAALLAVLLVALLAGATVARAAAGGKPDYKQEIDAWRADRDKGLRDENGWLTLVGLYWLDEGENKMGSDAGNKVILPAGKAAPVAGTLIRKGKEVSLRVEPGTEITVDGKPLSAAATPVFNGDPQAKPVTLHLGSLSFFVIQRGDKVGVRIKDSQSPALAAFRGLDFFPLQQGWHVQARFEPYKPAKKIPIANVLGQISDEDSPGAVVFDWKGKTYRLDALPGDDKGSLFLIFADQTNGKETYGAGRFLEAEPPRDGKVVVDFNTAYNPPCAFTAFATCPLPPRQNRLAVRVEAGEKKYGEGHPGH